MSYSRIQFVEGPPSSSAPGAEHEEVAVATADLNMDDRQDVAEEEGVGSIQPLQRVSVGLDAKSVNAGTPPANLRDMSSIPRSDSSLHSQTISTPARREKDWENIGLTVLPSFNTVLSPIHGSSHLSTPTQASDVSTEAHEVDLMRYYRYVIARRVCHPLQFRGQRGPCVIQRQF